MPELAQHPRARYVERYGAALTEPELRALELRLGAGEGMLLRRNPDGAGDVRVIRCAGQLVVVVYSLATGQVKTFLPADAAFVGRRRG